MRLDSGCGVNMEEYHVWYWGALILLLVGVSWMLKLFIQNVLNYLLEDKSFICDFYKRYNPNSTSLQNSLSILTMQLKNFHFAQANAFTLSCFILVRYLLSFLISPLSINVHNINASSRRMFNTTHSVISNSIFCSLFFK